jgi:hypothetical protein
LDVVEVLVPDGDVIPAGQLLLQVVDHGLFRGKTR